MNILSRASSKILNLNMACWALRHSSEILGQKAQPNPNNYEQDN